MGTKNNPGKFDCYANAEPDEPIFVLLGRDPHAYKAVWKWAEDREALVIAGAKPITDMAMVDEAYACATEMRKYSVARSRR